MSEELVKLLRSLTQDCDILSELAYEYGEEATEREELDALECEVIENLREGTEDSVMIAARLIGKLIPEVSIQEQ